jgi:putative endonuclease
MAFRPEDMGIREKGIIGEELARHFLSCKGYKILLKNYECPLGEIDLVAKHRGVLVFIEVKTRTSEAMGLPAEAVTYRKRGQIVKTASYYLKRYGLTDVLCRFDVVSVLLLSKSLPKIELIQNAFQTGE